MWWLIKKGTEEPIYKIETKSQISKSNRVIERKPLEQEG